MVTGKAQNKREGRLSLQPSDLMLTVADVICLLMGQSHGPPKGAYENSRLIVCGISKYLRQMLFRRHRSWGQGAGAGLEVNNNLEGMTEPTG